MHAYPTPDALFRALEGLNVSDGKSLLADLEAGAQRVGDLRALEVYYTFMAGGDDSVMVGSPPRAASAENVSICDADLPRAQERAASFERDDPKSTKSVIEAQPNLPAAHILKHRTLSNDTPFIPSAKAIELLDSPSPSFDESDGSPSSENESEKTEHLTSPKQRHCARSRFVPCTSPEQSEIRGSPNLLVPSSDPSLGLAGRSVLGNIRNPSRKHPRSSASARESIDSLDIEIAMLSTKRKGRAASMNSQSSNGIEGAQKGITLFGTNTSDSEDDEPLELRVRRLREKLNLVNDVVATKVNAPALIRKATRPRATTPVPREVSISEDDDSLCSTQQEIIELSD